MRPLSNPPSSFKQSKTASLDSGRIGIRFHKPGARRNLGPKSRREILAKKKKKKSYWLEEIDISILKRLKCKSGIQVELQNQKVKKEKKGKFVNKIKHFQWEYKGHPSTVGPGSRGVYSERSGGEQWSDCTWVRLP